MFHWSVRLSIGEQCIPLGTVPVRQWRRVIPIQSRHVWGVTCLDWMGSLSVRAHPPLLLDKVPSDRGRIAVPLDGEDVHQLGWARLIPPFADFPSLPIGRKASQSEWATG
ncbi:hypothetical protein chiPu_0028629 [Chiloscyllium punctatum]|uniref:Uncharacterized protein n=1 Tax=Chiloscyllium punctatum TaxID=137246 RepID=A0A401TPU0_CHIPU|nr:hypothetical protein [Chiloscyllium punctatum]